MFIETLESRQLFSVSIDVEPLLESQTQSIVQPMAARPNLVGRWSGYYYNFTVDGGGPVHLKITKQTSDAIRVRIRVDGEIIVSKLDAKIRKDRTFTFTYRNEDVVGKAKGKVSKNGNVLSGTYTVKSPRVDWVGEFKLRRQA